ncbi:MAG: endolytic transglycosylase MltG [Ferruginibacter sp.]
MKSFLRLIVFCLFIAAIFLGWRFLGSNTNFNQDKKSFFIKTGSTFEDVVNGLQEQYILKNPESFEILAQIIHYDKNIRPGRYVISNGASIYKVLRLLNSGKQTAVSFVITKLRTKQDLAAKVAANFECDSATFIQLP